jgi:hypothetical protein
MVAEPSGNGEQTAPEFAKGVVPVFGANAIYIFAPEEDITVAELAGVMGVILLAPISVLTQKRNPGVDVFFERLSDGCKRHFRVEKYSDIVVPGVVPRQ